jgi:hypothetical protein
VSNIRRGYIYLACIASLEAVAWATVALLRGLLVPDTFRSVEDTAWPIAVIVVGLPIFLAHWLWAQRLASGNVKERGAVVRRLYLYGAMATFLGPFVANTVDLLDDLLRLAFGPRSGDFGAALIVHPLVAMGVMAVLWAYHWWVATADAREVPEREGASPVRRLYLYGFSAAGLTMTALAAIGLARWLMFQVGGGGIAAHQAGLTRDVARLVVGLPLWLTFWSRAQRLFAAPDDEERASAVRKLYLYLAVFAGVLATATTLTLVLADLLERVLAGPRPGGLGSSGDIREALSVLLGAGVVWAYHAAVLRRDAALAREPAGQAWIRQLYGYLVAAIGLGAFLAGLAGEISVLIRALSGVQVIRGVPEEVARFTALILVGLPLWMLPWRRLQLAATAPGPTGDEESQSVIRKLYLYFYLLLATLTVLGSGVYIVFRLVSLALGERPPGNLLADLGQAIAYSLIAVGVWLYHGALLRADGRRAREAETRRWTSLRVAVLDAGDGRLGRALLDELRHELPGLDLRPLGLTAEAAAVLGTAVAAGDVAAVVAQSDLIVGPWTVVAPGGVGGAVSADLAQAVSASPAHKLLIPAHVEVGTGPAWSS